MKCIKIPQPLHLFWIRSSIDIWYFNKLKCGFLKKSFLMNAPLVVTFGWVHSKTNKKVWTVRWFNFYGNLCHFIAYPTCSSNIHASVFTCLTLFWNGFYADISKDRSCNRQSPALFICTRFLELSSLKYHVWWTGFFSLFELEFSACCSL